MQKANRLLLNLQRFADGGEAGTAQGEATATADGTQLAQQTEQTDPAEGKKPDKRAEFIKMTRGDYKDVYAAEVQKVIDARFKETKVIQERDEKLKPALQRLAVYYGIDGNNVDALSEAITKDDRIYADLASETGMPLEKAKELQDLRIENHILKQSDDDRRKQEQANVLFSKWAGQAEEAKQFYPELDFGAEMQQNQQFGQLMSAGVDVKTAYEIVHRDEIFTRLAMVSAEKAKKTVVDDIKAKGVRPVENGIAAQSGVTTSTDVSKLSNADMDDIIRRVRQGERIDFKS